MIKVSQVTEKSEGDIIFTPHCHSTIEVDYFIEGSGRYSVAGTEHSISPGDVFVFSNNIIHKITYIAPQPDMKILKVHFSPVILMQDRLFSGLDKIFFRTFGFTHIPASDGTAGKVRDILWHMLDESADSHSFKSDELMTALLLAMCVSIGRYVESVGGCVQTYCDDNHRAILETIRYINNNLNTTLTLDALSRMVNMSKNSYLHWFKHFNGISPYSYIQSVRILRSVDMLKNTSMPVTHIAFECGFNNTVSYNKMFKKVMGCTPTDIRRGKCQR